MNIEWKNGSPPNFGEEKVWIVAEIPSLFSQAACSYRTFVWLGNGWSDKAVHRATKWAVLPLPKKEGADGEDTKTNQDRR